MFIANVVVDFVIKGGPIMYPILAVGLVAVCVVVERSIWWIRASFKRSPGLLDEIYDDLQAGAVARAVS